LGLREVDLRRKRIVRRRVKVRMEREIVIDREMRRSGVT